MKNIRILLPTVLFPALVFAEEQPAQNYWEPGIRTGIVYDVAKPAYYGSKETYRHVRWGQQFFLGKQINKHLALEMSVLHYQVKADFSGQKKNAFGQYYDRYKIQHQNFRHQLLFQYKIVNRNRLRISPGIGFAVQGNIEKYDMAYEEQGLFIEGDNSLINIEVAGIAALNARYSITEHISVNVQTGGILFPHRDLYGFAGVAGIGYRF